MRRGRQFDRTVRAVRKQGEADRLARLGMSDPMWDRLEDLHLARLNKERGRRAKEGDRTLRALLERGLATYTDAAVPCLYCGGGECGPGVVLWATTVEGKALAMRGRE